MASSTRIRETESGEEGASPTAPESPDAPASAASRAASGGRTASSRSILRPCPYLRNREGYRLAHSNRDQICEAGDPRSRIPGYRQESVCLAAAHVDCDRFLSAQALAHRLSPVGAPMRRHVAATAPVVVLGPGHPSLVPAHRPHLRVAGLAVRRTLPRATAVLAGLALALVLLGQLIPAAHTAVVAPQTSPSSTPTETPTLSAEPSAELSPVALLSPSPEASPEEPSASPSPAPTVSASPLTPTPAPARTFRTYTVRSGDSLSRIAEMYGTTARAIQTANGMGSSETIWPGQVLKIP